MPSSHLIGNLLVKIGNYHVNSDPRIQESYVTNTLHTLKTCQEKNNDFEFKIRKSLLIERGELVPNDKHTLFTRKSAYA